MGLKIIEITVIKVEDDKNLQNRQEIVDRNFLHLTFIHQLRKVSNNCEQFSVTNPL